MISKTDGFLLTISMVFFLADTGAGVMVILQYYIVNCYIWMLSTLSLVCVSSFLIQLLSMRLYVSNKSATNYLWIIHIFQLGILNRYLELFSLLWKSKKSNMLSKVARLHSDIHRLRLLESFTKSALQFLMQLYIMMATNDHSLWTRICVASSVFSLSCQLVVSNRAAHSKAQYLFWLVLTLQFLWQVGMVCSRILAMVFFATVFGSWIVLFIVFHWFTMILWVNDDKMVFYDSWWEERLYKCIVGIVYCFCFISLEGKPCRKREIVFQIFSLFQCVGLLGLCYSTSERPANIETLIYAIIVTILTGLVYIYLYWLCHQESRVLAKSAVVENGKICQEQLSNSINNTVQNANGDLSSPGHSTISCAGPKSVSPNSPAENTVDIDHHASVPKKISHLHHSNSLDCSGSLQPRLSLVQPLHGRCTGLNYRSLPDIFFSDSMYAIKGYTFPKSFASHFKTVNYNFRTSVAFGEQHSKISCSCLVLHDSGSSLYDNQPYHAPYSASLPNEKPDESYNSSHVASVVDTPLYSVISSQNHSRKSVSNCNFSQPLFNVLQFSGAKSESFRKEFPALRAIKYTCPFVDSSIHPMNGSNCSPLKHSENSSDCVKLGALYHSVSA